MPIDNFSHLGCVNSHWLDVLEKMKTQEETPDAQQENLLDMPNRIEEKLNDEPLQVYNIKRDGMSRRERRAYERMLDKKMKKKGNNNDKRRSKSPSANHTGIR